MQRMIRGGVARLSQSIERDLRERDKDPWIIAMDGLPTQSRVRDYGMRWGIEALFSDFKSRGFGITQTKLGHASRISRLILVLTMAIYFAASTAMKPDPQAPKYTLKKPIAA